jgi:transaldolase / glucose-6-phosphate isomerase
MANAINPLKALGDQGQSVWLDYIRRNLLTSGDLARHIEEDGLRGMTSNPAIFEKAISGSTDYKDILDAPSSAALDSKSLYEAIAFRDIRDAADVLAPLYAKTGKGDGYVSLEVSPFLAYDTEGTLSEARRLWKAVARPNVMIKVPGTPEGLPAIRQLLSEGINVNITLLFSQATYEKVVEAYLAGLEARLAEGGDVSGVASVASFFVSRIDSAVDALLTARMESTTDAAEKERLKALLGKAAIANAKLAYEHYEKLFASPRFEALRAKGARSQRLLWASTGTKNPSYRDVLYVEELIGPDTVNTIPPATFDAFRDHGRVRPTLREGVAEARAALASLESAGVSLDAVTSKLLDDGVTLFVDAFRKLLQAVNRRAHEPGAAKTNRQSFHLPADVAAAVDEVLDDWTTHGNVRRLWAGDATLWSGKDESRWLGWLRITDDQIAHLSRLRAFSDEVRAEGFSHAVLLGMGGSSLCPEVLSLTFGKTPGFPELLVLDSTDPGQILALEKQLDVAKTLFIVSSKSGSTLEPNIFKQYFFDRVRHAVGEKEAGRRFVAVTDPGSRMQQVAEADGFRHVFFGWPSIGGRYSALSNFGLAPAAAMGLDVTKFLDRTEEMVQACAAVVKPRENPGVHLGALLGAAATRFGRDKITIVASPGLHDLGAWLEQLIAESTGKLGKGLIPIDREALGAPSVYGNDRVFAYLRLDAAPDTAQDQAVAALETAGQPVVRIAIDESYDIGEEFFRWEIATAVAGSVLGINPFDQPDVEAAKIATRDLTTEYEKTGALRAESPIFTGDGVKLFTDGANAAALEAAAGKAASLAKYMGSHLGRLGPGDYFALLAYLPMNAENERRLQAMRHAVRDAKTVATCLGFGPRFQHSTGQAYKGGPNTGVFLQVTCDDAVDVKVPGQKYTFGIVKAAQARGDFQVLADRKRRALRVHLGPDVAAGLETLSRAFKEALS